MEMGWISIGDVAASVQILSKPACYSEVGQGIRAKRSKISIPFRSRLIDVNGCPVVILSEKEVIPLERLSEDILHLTGWPVASALEVLDFLSMVFIMVVQPTVVMWETFNKFQFLFVVAHWISSYRAAPWPMKSTRRSQSIEETSKYVSGNCQAAQIT